MSAVGLWRLVGAGLFTCLTMGPLRPCMASPRPYDAPASADRAAVPDVTPEYHLAEDAGIRLVYHPIARERASPLLARAAAIREELSVLLERELLTSMEIRLAAAPAQMAGLSPVDIPSGVAAVVFRNQRLVVMSLGATLSGPPPDLEERLRHALAHLALDEAVAGHDLPRWFHEGFAVQVAGEEAGPRAETLCLAAFHDRLWGLREVEARFPEGSPAGSLAVAEAADFARFLLDHPSRARMPAILERVRAGQAFEPAMAATLGADLATVEFQWRKEMARRYSFVPVFVGTTLLWLAVAGGVLLRRRQAARPREERAPRVTAKRLSSHEQSGAEENFAHASPPEPDVPRVAHRGRWYTLH